MKKAKFKIGDKVYLTVASQIEMPPVWDEEKKSYLYLVNGIEVRKESELRRKK
jgi:hypothetical protein